MSQEHQQTPETQTLSILPLKNVVIFPGTVRPLFFSRTQSLNALKEVAGGGGKVFVVTLRNPDKDPLSHDDLYDVGVIGSIVKLQRLPNGAVQALFRAEERGSLVHADLGEKLFRGKIAPLISRESADQELPQLVEALKSEFFQHLDVDQRTDQFQWNEELMAKDIPAGQFADAVAPFVKAEIPEHQEILATLDTRERVERVYTLLLKEVKQKQFEQTLKQRVEEAMGKRQKEYFLNEQMKAIREELGEDEGEDEIEALRKKIEAADMPKHAREVADKELKKLSKSAGNPHEATPIRNYLDWLVSLPWSKITEDNLDVDNAQDILDQDHFGLDKPKERIIEYIAVANAVGKLKGPILCLSGPPGVGKTSLAKSIARALNREFARISLGGVRDEAEIRGHRRTYIGSLPGKLIQTMKKLGSTNPVILLDEIDKVSQHYTGGPTAALLEVLDPEQNNAFMDHYLEIEYDLSRVLFICTANDLSTVPAPLRDRMEIIELSGYTELEKLQIAKKYLLPKQMDENGLAEDDIRMGSQQILGLIRGYTREAGVRSLERVIAKVCRKAVTEKLRQKTKKTLSINAKRTAKYLGPARFAHNEIEQEDAVGMVTGLAWTSVGGETLSIEVTAMKGTGKIQLTGKLGDVMKESAQAALSYVRTHANALGVYSKVFKDLDLHIHVPAGGTPKDGPSAGIALTAGIVSALTKIPIRWQVGLTGEVTLRGRVLPIGGLKEKLLAAKRAELTQVLIPADNQKDLAEISRDITDGLDIRPVSHVRDVLPLLLDHLPIAVDDADLESEEQPTATHDGGGHDTPFTPPQGVTFTN